MNETVDIICDVQMGFRNGMGCLKKVFFLKCVTEKYLVKNWKVYCEFIDIQKHNYREVCY